MTASSSMIPAMPSKAELVYENLRERILTGELRPGERLSMDALAKDFGVSKIPVREAIGRLESLKLVVSRPHVGPSVAEMNAVQLEGVYRARAALEPEIAALAASAISREELAVLDGIQTAMRERLTAGDLATLSDLNYRFHMTQASATGYEIFGEFTETMLLSVRRHRVIDPLDTENWAAVVREHDEILTALRDGDPVRAARAALLHATSQHRHDAVGTAGE